MRKSPRKITWVLMYSQPKNKPNCSSGLSWCIYVCVCARVWWGGGALQILSNAHLSQFEHTACYARSSAFIYKTLIIVDIFGYVPISFHVIIGCLLTSDNYSQSVQAHSFGVGPNLSGKLETFVTTVGHKPNENQRLKMINLERSPQALLQSPRVI